MAMRHTILSHGPTERNHFHGDSSNRTCCLVLKKEGPGPPKKWLMEMYPEYYMSYDIKNIYNICIYFVYIHIYSAACPNPPHPIPQKHQKNSMAAWQTVSSKNNVDEKFTWPFTTSGTLWPAWAWRSSRMRCTSWRFNVSPRGSHVMTVRKPEISLFFGCILLYKHLLGIDFSSCEKNNG